MCGSYIDSPTILNTLPGSDVTIDVVCSGYANESHSYSDWINVGYLIGTVNDNSTLSCSMTVTLNSGVGNSDANKAAIFDAIFSGTVGI